MLFTVLVYYQYLKAEETGKKTCIQYYQRNSWYLRIVNASKETQRQQPWTLTYVVNSSCVSVSTEHIA